MEADLPISIKDNRPCSSAKIHSASAAKRDGLRLCFVVLYTLDVGMENEFLIIS